MDRRQFLKAIASCVVLSSLMSVANGIAADEPKSAALIQTLPTDGAWVDFNANVKINGQEIVPSWTVRSVGQAFHGGKQCRFLEMDQSSETEQLPKTMWRVLVPEDEFGEGKDPLSKAVKRWVKIGTNEPEAVDSIELKDPIFAMLLAGPKQNLKNEEAKEKINRAIGDLAETYLVGTFEEAVLLAYQKSRSGDIILLSPGCASYDMFRNFEERGEYFKKLVAQL